MTSNGAIFIQVLAAGYESVIVEPHTIKIVTLFFTEKIRIHNVLKNVKLFSDR